MSTEPITNAETTDDADAPDAEHTIKATKALLQEIHDAAQAAELGEDIWDTLEVNEPDKPASMVSFTIEGDDGLFYTLQLVPKED